MYDDSVPRLRRATYAVSMVGLPAAAVAGTIGTVVLGLYNFSILGLYMAVPMVLAPLVVHRFSTRPLTRTIRSTAIDWRVLSIAFHLTIGALVLVTVSFDVRPIGFFAGVALAYALIFALIWTTPDTGRFRAICFYHLAIVLLLVVFSVTLKYEFFVGRTDLSTHIPLTNAVVETGRTPVLSQTYEAFVLWHVYAAGTYQLLGEWGNPRDTMYLLSGLLYGAGVPMMYALSNRVFRNEKAALLSCLVLISFPLYIFYGMYSISRSVTSILFLVLLVTLATGTSRRMDAVSVILLFAIVIYHPASIPFVLVILAILYAVQGGIGTSDRTVDRFVLLSAVLVTAIYWLYRAEYLVTRIADVIVTSFFGATTEAPPSGVTASPWVEVANYVPYSFLLFFVLIGFLFAIRDRGLDRSALASFGVVTLLLIPLSLPGPTLLIDSLAGINVSRFGQYTFMFLALVGGFGLYELVSRGDRKLFFALLVVVACFSFTAVSNDFVASDNPIVERPFYTYYLTDHELQSFETINDAHEGQLGSDQVACRYMNGIHGADCEVIRSEEGAAMFEPYDGVIIREGEHEKRPLQFSRYVYPNDLPQSELTERTKAYDSDSVTFYG